MPLLPEPSYTPPFWARNPHIHTIVEGKFRSIPRPDWTRQRIELPDGDFLDVDRLVSGHDRLCIVLHGLEGSTERPYMRTLAHALKNAGWDVAAVNFRGCSGETNRMARSYHSGATKDVVSVLDQMAPSYSTVAAVGFSLGGNVLLKHMGETGDANRVDAAVAISVPCDLRAGAMQLATRANWIYMWNFLRSLRTKIEIKAVMFPELVSMEGYDELRTFKDFDDAYTAPLHGFRDAEHYWSACSSLGYLHAIRRPTLILNALDDPFLPDACYPRELARSSDTISLEIPRFGGHVGFRDADGSTWSDTRVISFLETALS